MSVFSDVIMTLASDAASEIEGVEVLRSGDQSKKPIRGGGVSVYFLPNDKVTVDLNHPLAGENLHFKGKVLEVRDATEQELAALMGGGGCGGCGCGCDDDECEGGHCGGGCGGCH